MIIQELEWKNFKSFGEVVQKIAFNPNGELILLAGKNGSGKTAIKDAIEYALFGKISGKKKKFLAIKKAINRINSTNLRVGIKFLNNNNQFISISRNAEPNILKVLIDNEDKSEIFSNLSDKEKDKIIGFTYEIFKSFISMSMKNFEDFLQLTDAKKEELLNKLFQLEDLIAVQELVKELYTNNNQVYQFQIKRLEVLKKEIVNLKEIINALPDITDIDLKLEILKKNINSYKEPFIQKQTQFKNAEQKLFEFNKKIQEGSPLKIDYEKQMQKITWEQEQQESRLKLFEQGKCPYCLTNLTDDDHQEELIKLKEEIRLNGIKINEFKISIDECVLEEAKIINQQKYWKTQYIQIKEEFIKLQNEIKAKKEEYKILENRKNENINVQQLKDQFNKSAEEYRGIRNQVKKLIKKKEHYEILLELFKGTTLRQHMINQMLPSVNFYLKDFLEKLESPYNVKLTENFDAVLTEREDIDPETTSKGEDRKINLSIALSYLCALLDHNSCNLLFLDEVFDGIDTDNVDLILKILKDITRKYKVNIIIVHHNIMDKNHFDKILEVKKTTHSDLSDIIIKK